MLLFGAKKPPQLARGIGQSAREFKKGLQEEEKKDE
ncbi:twin-arginine translocase TatA/TatE family subunit, partial [Shewanella sp. C31]|nr:twin-arginine translocase TatA/TatE family subunit [Shewanella electrica]